MSPNCGSWFYFTASALLPLWALAGCGPSVGNPPAEGGAVDSPAGSGIPGLPGSGGSELPNSDPNSVGGVIIAGGGSQPSGGSSPRVALSARVRNERASPADVTFRFVQESEVVHLAFLRALPNTVTQLNSPEMASSVVASGVADDGLALPSRTFAFGVDFDEKNPAEYVISASSPIDSTPGDLPADPGLPRPLPATLVLVEPAEDIEREVGEKIVVRWTDEGGSVGAVVQLYLRAVGAEELLPVGPAIGARLDGLNDTLPLLLEDLAEGEYEIVGRMIEDDAPASSSVASGRVMIVAPSSNSAPTVSLVGLPGLTVLQRGDVFRFSWVDHDPDDNATLTFTLVGSGVGGIPTGDFRIGPPIAEDPDGALADRLAVAIEDVFPGDYDLLATISDGRLEGSARLSGVLRVLPIPGNDPPLLTLTAPAAETNTEVGRFVTVRWEDSDADDDARLSLLLDPDLSGDSLDGDEILLVGALGEDLDGPSDRISLGITEDAAPGRYRVVGTLTDGLAAAVSFAPGLVVISTTDEGSGGTTPPQQVRRISVVAPVDDVRARLDGPMEFRIEFSGLPSSTPVRVFLLGVNLDGESLRADVTPPGFTLGMARDASSIVLRKDAVPNKWQPRSFVISVEAAVNGVRYETTAPGRALLRQEVEIESVRMINYWCADRTRAQRDTEDDLFFGIELLWQGGGYSGSGAPGIGSAVEPLAVEIWLTQDGRVSGQADRGHRRIARFPGSPHVRRVDRIGLDQLTGLELIGEPPAVEIFTAINTGKYQVFSVVEESNLGRTLAEAQDKPIEACYPPRIIEDEP